MSNITTTIRMPAELQKQVKIKCIEEGTSMSAVVKFLLEKWVEDKIKISMVLKSGGHDEVTPPKQEETKKPFSGGWLDNL